jgi:RHS repeat-associated protein
VNVTGTANTPAYDLNGNTLTDGAGKSYVWDAENRLTKIIYADNSSTEFQYNGISQRVRVIEKSAANTTISDKRYLWAGGNQPSEERDSSGTTVLKRYFPQGEQIPAAAAPLNKLFYSKDHLGNIRELTDSNGTLQTRYDYDMWGKRVKLSGTLESEVGYTGHHHHAKSELILTWFRAYDAEMGRWLSADPIGEAGGLNLYAYVGGNPANLHDPDGLFAKEIGGGLISLGLGYATARLSGECYSAKDAAIDFASGALGLGAIKNAGKAFKAYKKYRNIQRKFVPALRGPGLAPDAIEEGAKALGQGALGLGLLQLKECPGNLQKGALQQNLWVNFGSGSFPSV